MTKLTRYQPDAAFEARYPARTSFTLDNPENRVPPQGHDLMPLLTGQQPSRGTRADLLLADRGQAPGKVRSRVLAWLSPLTALAGWPDNAYAHDYSPRLSALSEASLGPRWQEWLAELAAQLSQVELSQPGFGLVLGSALLMTQVIGIRQRRLLLNTVAAQADLFPETLATEEPETAPSEKPYVWQADAATRQGQIRKENQDAVRLERFDDATMALIVCDGAGGIEGGRAASQSAVAVISAELRRWWDETGTLTTDNLTQGIQAARQAAQDRQLKGITTALVVLLQQNEMHYATLGDGAVAVIWPDGMVGQVQVPHHTAGQPSNIINAYVGHGCEVPPRLGMLRLEPGAMVMAMSDGASDLFPFEEFALDRAQYDQLDGLADRLLCHLEDARDPDSGAWLHSDNLTVALARLEAGVRHDEAN